MIYIMNIYIFFINLSFLIKDNKNKNILSQLLVKNVDSFVFKLMIKEFMNISYYLNSKYYNKKKNYLKNNHSKKIIILDWVDLYKSQKIQIWLNNTFRNQFLFIFDSNKPDYLIYNVFGFRHLENKYNNCIKIAYITENSIPDLNIADYAFGFQHINYLDRFYKFTNFYNISLCYIIRKYLILKNFKKTKFCGAVISDKLAYFRNKFIIELSKYKIVDMGGKYNNNIGKTVKNKIEFLSSYKFSISMENSEGDGYTSEKIYDSFISGTIPIYFGNYMIDEYFNLKSFILIKNEKDIFNKIEYIKKIDKDDELYKKILKENIFINNKTKQINDEQFKFFLIFLIKINLKLLEGFILKNNPFCI